MNKGEVTISTGESGEKIWIGAPTVCYDEVSTPFSGNRIHILSFTLKQAKAVVEMIQTEIDRKERKSSK